MTRRPPTTPAQCSRDVARLLLAHRASPSLLWSGHSPLSLSIASGNDLVSKPYPTGVPARVCLVPPLQRRLWDVLSLRCPGTAWCDGQRGPSCEDGVPLREKGGGGK